MKQFFTDCCGGPRARVRYGQGKAEARGAHHVREVLNVVHADVQQFDVEVLIDRVQRATDGEVCGETRIAGNI